MIRTAWLALALLVAGFSSGCVTRRVLITSDPPGAVVYRDGQPIGATPVEHTFVYYGKYRYRLVKDGFAPLDVEPELVAPWYQWIGVDFVSENLIPYTFRDTQVLQYQLMPLEAVRHDDVRARAERSAPRASRSARPPDRPRRGRRTNPTAPLTLGAATGGHFAFGRRTVSVRRNSCSQKSRRGKRHSPTIASVPFGKAATASTR